MPIPANITVKKADGTTDIVWSLLTASGGDKSPFVVRSDTSPGTNGQKPVMTMVSRWNGDQTARRIEGTISFPMVFTNSSTGLTEVRSKAILSYSAVVPQNMDAISVSEFAAQATNILASTLAKASIASGYAPA